MPSIWHESLLADQQARRQASLWRERSVLGTAQGSDILLNKRQVVNFSSNDYLGLANHPKLMDTYQLAVAQWGAGAGASHLVCGHQVPHHELEKQLASFLGAESALLFANGYMANLAICTALAHGDDLILQDKLNHASLIDGAQLSRARLKRYAHVDVEHAERLLKSAEFDKCMLVTDGVFSMEGDVAPLAQLYELAQKNNGLLVVDDAHGLGVCGRSGAGTLDQFGLRPQGDVLIMGTLGKALGVYGAFVAGDEVFIQQLIQSARSYIYTTALPPSVALAAQGALRLLGEGGDELRQKLNDNIDHFRRGVSALNLSLMPSRTPIQPLVLGAESIALELSQTLLNKGYLVSAIRPPTVPKGSARLRFTISASHSKNQIDNLLTALQSSLIELEHG